MIKSICYELYKTDWKRSHMITAEREMDSIKNYYEWIINNNVSEYNDYTYENYIEEVGYDGEIYVCYNEFCDEEYYDEDYIVGLLDNEKLIELYYKDIKSEE